MSNPENNTYVSGIGTFDLELQAGLGNPETIISSPNIATLEAFNNEVSYIEFSQALYSGIESDQPYPNEATITLTRIGNVNNWADVEVWLTGGSAQQGLDFNSPYGFPHPVTFQPGEEIQTFSLDIFDDYEIEGTETVEFELRTFPGNLETVIGTQDTATLEILDNEVSYIEFSQSLYSVNEGDSPIGQTTINLTRTGNLDNWADVEFWIVGGSAQQGSDFSSPVPQWVSFEPGQESQIVYIDIFDDGLLEGTETVNFELRTYPGNLETAIGSQNTATLEIFDSETSYIEFSQDIYSVSESDQPHPPNQAAITLTRTGNVDSWADIEVLFTDGTATEAIDFGGSYGVPQWVTFQPGDTTQTLYLDIYSDSEIEGIETVNLELIPDPGKIDILIGSQNIATLEISDFEPSGGNSWETGFETGDFTDWNVLGNTNIETANFGVNPTEGNYQALLTSGNGSVSDSQLEAFVGLNPGELDSLINNNATEGSAIKREITVEAGDILNFDWNFLTSEGTPSYYNDFAFVSVSDGYLSKLADTNSQFNFSNTNLSKETSYGTFSYQFTNSGSFTIGVGVSDLIDSVVDSALLVDNFSVV